MQLTTAHEIHTYLTTLISIPVIKPEAVKIWIYTERAAHLVSAVARVADAKEENNWYNRDPYQLGIKIHEHQVPHVREAEEEFYLAVSAMAEELAKELEKKVEKEAEARSKANEHLEWKNVVERLWNLRWRARCLAWNADMTWAERM